VKAHVLSFYATGKWELAVAPASEPRGIHTLLWPRQIRASRSERGRAPAPESAPPLGVPSLLHLQPRQRRWTLLGDSRSQTPTKRGDGTCRMCWSGAVRGPHALRAFCSTFI